MLIPKHKPVRDKAHLEFIRTLPCLICGIYGVDAHHVRAFQLRTMGKRIGDDKVVPLCRAHHDFVHSICEEHAWHLMGNRYPPPQAQRLYQHTGDANTCETLIREWRG